ncbi:hypothetical protein OAM69_03450 [bacterium]|nr:hypothetical protein [bacterium]
MRKLNKELSEHFPNVTRENHNVTSEETPDYNCIAWAVGIDDQWWDPADGYCWPDGAIFSYEAKALFSAYEQIGFVECENSNLEKGYQKVALYRNSSGFWTHAARQMPDGGWASKLGKSVDIVHDDPETVCGEAYGVVAGFMKRNIS